MGVEIVRGTARFVDREAGRLTRHALSFGEHYDPERLAFGPMVCHDDHLLGARQGFDTHRHSGLEIFSFVVSGELRHRGPDGEHLVPAGSIAHLHTGDGVEHAEHASAAGGCRFVQVWLRADDDSDPTPTYDVLSGDSVRLRDAEMRVVRLAANQTYALPTAPMVHAFVVDGALLRSSLAEPLSAGDAFWFTDEPGHAVTAGVDTVLLVWCFGVDRIG